MTYRPYRNESTRSSILAGAADPADAAAWARFFDTYAGYVFGIARRRGLPEADADEIVQQVMGGLVHGNGLAQYDRSKGAFHLWLARRTAWRVANFRRDGEVRHAAEAGFSAANSEEAAASPETDAACEEEWRAAVLAEALRRLREESNPVEGLGTDAVRRMHGIGADNLYQIRRRLGARLRELLPEVKRDLEDGGALPPSGE